MNNCPSCGSKPIAELHIQLDPVICFSARLKCNRCKLSGPIFDEIESKSVKDLVHPATDLWNSFCENFKQEIENVSLGETISDWLKENEI